MTKQTLAFADTQAKNSKQTLEQMLANGTNGNDLFGFTADDPR